MNVDNHEWTQMDTNNLKENNTLILILWAKPGSQSFPAPKRVL
jgi:hypothetical protein